VDVDLAAIERGFRAWAGLAQRGPQTLLHGDPHPGNTYALGATIGFYDWQLVRRGAWVHDVGYFIVSSLPVSDRRAYERDLLAGYFDVLARRGGTPPDDGWDQYCKTPVYGLGAWLQTIAAGTFQPVDTCLVAIERFTAAYRDLSNSRLPVRRSHD
jgi:aminoglycoside phosphotransferase (APT) family kinase protein